MKQANTCMPTTKSRNWFSLVVAVVVAEILASENRLQILVRGYFCMYWTQEMAHITTKIKHPINDVEIDIHEAGKNNLLVVPTKYLSITATLANIFERQVADAIATVRVGRQNVDDRCRKFRIVTVVRMPEK